MKVLLEISSPYYHEAVRLRHDVLYSGFDFESDAVLDEYEEGSLHLATIAKDRSSVQAYCRLTALNSTRFRLAQLVVIEDMQNLGVGSDLLRFAIDKAWASGAQEISIQARLGLRRFYEKFGFRFSGPSYFGRRTSIPHCPMLLRRDLSVPALPVHTLDSSESNRFWRQLEDLPKVFNSWDHVAACLYPAFSFLPKSLLEALRLLKRHPASPGFLMLRGLLPWRRLKPLGIRAENSSGTLAAAEIALLSCGNLLGEPFAFLEENSGQLIQDLRPKREHKDSLAGTGSARTLKPHTDGAHLGSLAPAYVLLACMQSSEDVGTLLVDAQELVGSLGASTKAALRRPDFIFSPPHSFASADSKTVQQAALLGPSHSPRLRLQLNTMRAANSSAEAAMEELIERIRDTQVHRRVVLSPGDLLIIDNNRAIHGRESFVARFDASDRHLKRLYVSATPLRNHGCFDPENAILAIDY